MQVTTKAVKKGNRLCMKSLPPKAECTKDVFQTQPPISGVNLSINMSVLQTMVNMSETEHYTTFETSHLLTISRINPIPQYLGKTFLFIAFRLLENAFLKFSIPLLNAIISFLMYNNPP